jgi:hypothetical protein
MYTCTDLFFPVFVRQSKLIPIIFSRLILDGVAGIQFVFNGKIQHCLAIVNAHFSFYAKISKTLLIAPSGKIYIIKAKPLAFIFFNNNYSSKTIYLPPEKFLIN